MKNILIEAYSDLNLGDDLFIKILTNKYENHNFYIFTNFKYKELKNIKNLKILNYNLTQKIINKLCRYFKISQNYVKKMKLKHMDVVVEIGGSLFIENSLYRKALDGRNEILRKINNNYYLLGANFGPYYTEEYKNEYKYFFSKCKDVCFREKFSYNIFQDLKNVRMAKDIVFSLQDLKSEEEEYILYSIIKPSIRKGLEDKDEKYYDQIIKSSINLIKNGKKIKYMSFCKSEGDEEAIEIILNKIPKEYLNSISIYYYSGDIDEALSILKKSEIIIATRFHAMILGFIYEKKVLPIAYSNKTINVLNDLSFEGEYIQFNELDKLTMATILKSKKLNKDKLENAKQDSLKHFEKLDIYLNSDKNEK